MERRGRIKIKVEAKVKVEIIIVDTGKLHDKKIGKNFL